MKKNMTAVIFLLAYCHPALAIPVTLFIDTPTYIERAKDIVIAKCISEPDYIVDGGMYDVQIIKVLKGDKQIGACKVFAVEMMKKGRTYLLASSGGRVGDADFLATAEVSVVAVASFIDLEKLQRKNLTDQLHTIFSGRLYELHRQLAPLLAEKELLDKAVVDRTDNLFVTTMPAQIGQLYPTDAKEYKRGEVTYLRFGAKQMEWSRQSDKKGYLYFQEPETRMPKWEFAFLQEKEFEALKGKKLALRFNGMYTPGCGQSIAVSEGQIIADRDTDEPTIAYIMKLDRQEGDILFARYCIVKQSGINPFSKPDSEEIGKSEGQRTQKSK
jgi:hypothetical protein